MKGGEGGRGGLLAPLTTTNEVPGVGGGVHSAPGMKSLSVHITELSLVPLSLGFVGMLCVCFHVWTVWGRGNFTLKVPLGWSDNQIGDRLSGEDTKFNASTGMRPTDMRVTDPTFARGAETERDVTF